MIRSATFPPAQTPGEMPSGIHVAGAAAAKGRAICRGCQGTAAAAAATVALDRRAPRGLLLLEPRGLLQQRYMPGLHARKGNLPSTGKK